jgi:hypothetical protein
MSLFTSFLSTKSTSTTANALDAATPPKPSQNGQRTHRLDNNKNLAPDSHENIVDDEIFSACKPAFYSA